MKFRVGIGYDIHRLVKGRRLFIGGIKIPHAKGLLGHSDADVLIHAICDSLLGAIACGDIGEHFPDIDPRYKNVSSVELLKMVCNLVKKKKYKINNIDAVIIAEEPKLFIFKEKMQQKLANILMINKDVIGIKAKTNEGLGRIGEKEAIACYAVTTVKRK
jgi:2-C-methyl-D-erythritol 2,4-cyclodiphosphate synthase